MPDSIQALLVLVLILPGCLGYFAFTGIYNGKIEDNVSKVVYIALLNLLPILIYGWITKQNVWNAAAGSAGLELNNVVSYVHSALFRLSVVSVILGIVAGLLGNWRPLQSWLIRGQLTRRNQDSSVLASLIHQQPDAFFKFRFKSGGYVIGHPKLYSLSGEEQVIFLDKAARRPAKPSSDKPQPPEYAVEGAGIVLVNFDDVQCVEVLKGRVDD